MIPNLRRAPFYFYVFDLGTPIHLMCALCWWLRLLRLRWWLPVRTGPGSGSSSVHGRWKDGHRTSADIRRCFGETWLVLFTE